MNTYPPPFAVAMAPLEAARRLVGDRPIRYLWGAAQLCALAFFTLGFGRLLGLSVSLGAMAVGWLCTWRYIVGDLNNQNTTLFLLALVTGALTLAARGSRVGAGALLGVGAALKIWPAAALWLLLLEGWGAARRAAVGFALGLAAAAGVTVAVLGPGRAVEAVRFWLLEVGPKVGGPGLLNQSWRGLTLRLLTPAPELLSPVKLLPGPGVGVAKLVALAVGGGVFALVPGWVTLRPARSRAGRAPDDPGAAPRAAGDLVPLLHGGAADGAGGAGRLARAAAADPRCGARACDRRDPDRRFPRRGYRGPSGLARGGVLRERALGGAAGAGRGDAGGRAVDLEAGRGRAEDALAGAPIRSEGS